MSRAGASEPREDRVSAEKGGAAENEDAEKGADGRESTRRLFHRFKNHLQMVSSMIELQAAQVSDAGVGRQLAPIQRRVFAMATMWDVAQQGGDLEKVAIDRALMQVAADLHRRHSFERGGGAVEPTLQVESLTWAVDQALPLLLVASELLANALEHGMPAAVDGSGEETLRGPEIRLEQRTGGWTLTVLDHGPGLPAEIDLEESQGLGVRLCGWLAEQLGGSFEIESGHGVVARLVVPSSAGR